MSRLSNTVAMVTGAASGIGWATAQLFAAKGAEVIAADVVALPDHDDPRIHFHELDVTEEKSWATVVDQVLREHGRVDVLVNNAGVIGYTALHELSVDEWDRVIGVDQTGVFLGMRTVIPPMLAQGKGSIINLSSAWGVVGADGVSAYQAAKGAVRGLTRNAAVTYARRGIRVNTVIPGWIRTPLTDRQPDDINQGVIDLTPLGVGADPEDIAYGCLYLACDESKYVTGSELAIDGGLLAQ